MDKSMCQLMARHHLKLFDIEDELILDIERTTD